jgi:ATP-dependent Clp protease ATP-binding subunit ClpA
MDHATLTDNNGKKADFRNVVLIMTTNAGAREVSGKGIGFQTTQAGVDEDSDSPAPSRMTGSKGRGAIERTFSPEFRNRIDAWIAFNPLAFADIERVVDKFINELRGQLEEKQVTIVLTAPARTWLAHKGFDPLYGARPMARVIQSTIKEPLAEEILFGQLQGGGQVVIAARDGELVLEYPGSGSEEPFSHCGAA